MRTHLTTNPLAQVKSALKTSGYDSEGIVEATFKGLNSTGSVVYEIRYRDDNEPGCYDTGNVYLKFENNEWHGEF
jgi:hypothetical protein